MPAGYQDAGVEPPLDEALTDPIVELLLARDGIDPGDLRRLLAAIRERLQRPDERIGADRAEAA